MFSRLKAVLVIKDLLTARGGIPEINEYILLYFVYKYICQSAVLINPPLHPDLIAMESGRNRSLTAFCRPDGTGKGRTVIFLYPCAGKLQRCIPAFCLRIGSLNLYLFPAIVADGDDCVPARKSF